MRTAFDALFAIDNAMADVVGRASQPALAAIKLAWWRERLSELDQGHVPAEPRLVAASRELLPRGLSGEALAELEEGWAALLEPVPAADRIASRGTALFGLGARLLGAEFGQELAAAGRLFVLIDAVRRGLAPAELVAEAPPLSKAEPIARPLTALAALADRDRRRGGPPFEAEATPGRAARLLRHRFTGR